MMKSSNSSRFASSRGTDGGGVVHHQATTASGGGRRPAAAPGRGGGDQTPAASKSNLLNKSVSAVGAADNNNNNSNSRRQAVAKNFLLHNSVPMQSRQQQIQRQRQEQTKRSQAEKHAKSTDSIGQSDRSMTTAAAEDGHLNVEEILWSRQIARTEIHAGNMMAPQRLRDMLERDVQLRAQKRPRPFLENSSGIGRSRSAKPGQAELMDWYNRDCLLIHRKWADLSADANASQRGINRAKLAAELPRHTFECESTSVAPGPVATRTRAQSIASSNGGCAVNGGAAGGSLGSTNSTHSRRERTPATTAAAGPDMELCCETVGEQKLDEWRETARRKTRGELLANLAAPGPLDGLELDEQQNATQPCWNGQRRLSVKFTRLSLLPPLENVFASVALYDVRMRQKLSEDFHLNSGSFTTTIGKCGDGGYAKRALFKLPEEEGGGSGAGDGLVLVFRLEKALQQGGLDAALEVYTKKQQQQQEGHENVSQFIKTSAGQKQPTFRQQIGLVAVPIIRTVENAFSGTEQHRSDLRRTTGGGGPPRSFTDSFIQAYQQNSEKQLQQQLHGNDPQSDTLSECSSSADRFSCSAVPIRTSNSWSLLAGHKFSTEDPSALPPSKPAPSTQQNQQQQQLRSHRWSRHLIGCPLSVRVSHFLKSEPLAESELFDWLQALLGTGSGQQQRQGNRSSEKIPLDMRLELEICQLEEVAREGWRIVSPECRLLNFHGIQNGAGEEQGGGGEREEWMELLEGTPLLAQDILPFPVSPRLISPNSFARHLLFLYPRFVNFSSRTGQNARNICVHVELLDAQMRRLDAFVADDGNCLVGSVHSPVQYHSKQPQFAGVEWKLLLPTDPPEGLHLRFKFVHVSCRPRESGAGTAAKSAAAAAMPGQTETPIGFSWLPLHPTADAHLPTGDQHLPISLDPLPPAICFLSPQLAFPNVHWLDGHRPLFHLSLQLVSSIQPQDPHLCTFLRLSSQWSAITATNDFSSSSPPPPTIVVDELTQAVRNLLKIRPEPMLAFLPILLHRILAILHSTNGGGNGTEPEESAAALAQCCFDILCQLAKIATMLLDANADTWGRSRILLDFVREQALPEEEVGRQTAAAADVNGNVKTEEEETKNKMPLMGTGRIGVEKGRGEKLLLANGGAEDMLNNNNSKGMDGTATKKIKQQQPLHEQLARLFLCSQGTARDTACTFCWFPLSLIHRSMVEHLVRTDGQLLPRHMRFSAPFVAHLAQLGELLGDELFDRLPKNLAQTQAINHAWAKFLRGSISLMSRSLVLRLFKRHCQLMDTRIETLQLMNPALADQLLSLKLAFIRTLYSHEHFLFLCLPFADLPTTVPAAAVEPQKGAVGNDEPMKRSMTNLSTMASRRTQQHNNNSSSNSNISNLGNRMMNKMPALNKSPSTSSPQLFGHPSAEHAHKHFPISLLLSQLHSLLIASSNSNSNSSNSPSLPACVDLLHWLIAAHESDWRLKDPELRQRLALIYSPLLSIVLELMNTGGGRGRGGSKGWFFPIVGTVGGTATTAFLDRSDADSGMASEEGGSNGTTAAAAATGNNNEKANGGVAGDEQQMRLASGRKLLLCLCWLLRSLHQPTLLHHLRQQFSPNQMSQFVLLLRSLVSMFAQQPPPQQRSARRNSADSFVQLNMLQIGPVPADELHLLLSSSTTATGASTCPPPPAAASAPATSSASSKVRLGRQQSVETNLSERGGSDRQTAMAMAAMEERSSHKGFLLMAEEEEESTATTAVRWRRKPAVGGGQEAAAHERAISRHLSTEVLLLVLDQFELLLQLAPCCSPALLLPEMARLLLHILAGHNSLAAQEHIFRSQRAFVRKFPEFLLDCQGGAGGAEQQQQSQLLLSGLCLQLLRHMGSELADTRAQAGISAFALLRASQRLHKGAFVRLGKTFTMALSSLVSNAAASGLALNDAILRQSLEAILQLRDGTEARKESAVWRAQLEELVANLGAILSDTLKLGACGDDVEMAVDLMQRIARGYRTNPELRIAWLMAIARKHLEEGRRNYAEAAQCLLHCCAILADQLASSGAVDDELLPHSVFQTFEELMGDNVREEWTQQGRAGRSAERVEQQQQPAAGLGMQQQQFSLSAFAEMVEKTAKLFERAQLFELVPTLFKLVFPMHERQHAHAKLIQLHAQIVSCLSRVEPPLLLALEEEDWPATGTGNCSADKRCFGTYFRVRFFGPRFGELDGQEFVYKEPAITKLSEISHRLEEFYAAKFGPEALVMIKDSNEVDVKSLDPGRAYIQITYVEPHFERWEQKRRRTHLQRSYRLRQFLYATPFTQQAGRAHGRLKEQFKRKTVLTLENSFPYVKTRLRVIRREQSVLAPIEVAIEDVQKRNRELAWAMAARPVDAKMLQMHLQGCIGTTVNQGPLEIARVFLAGASLDASGLPRDGAQRRLRLCFAELGRRCADALEMNARLMDPSREDYQLELCRNLNHFDQSMAMLSNHAPPQPSSLPAPPQSAAEDHSNGNAPSPAELVQALALAGKIGPISSV